MTGYVRQSAADIVPTGVVRAAPINNELNALRDAFVANGGHKHDGTAAEGHPVPVMGDSDLMNKIATDTSNNRHGVFVEVGGAAVEQVRFQDGAIVPVTDNDVDLGTSSNEFKNLYITGVANVDSLVADTADINGGTVDAAVIGATTPAAGTFTNLTANTSLVATTADINAGTIDGTVIGGAAAQAITGTIVTATTGFVGGLTGNVTGNTTGTHTGGVIGNVTGDVTGNVTASTGTSSFNDVTINGTLNMNAGTSATITNLTSPTNSGDAATKGYVDTADALKLNLSGGTMSGAIAMGTNKITGLGTPTANADAATKVYVDTSISNLVASAPGLLDTLDELAAALGDDPNFATTVTNSIATKLPLAGGTMSGAIAMGTNKITGLGDPTLAQDAATKTYVDTADALKLNLSGGTMSGAIAMGTNKITGLGNPTANQDAATKTYVDTADALKLSLTGGTMSGAIAMGTSKITGLGDPTANQDAATKIYVDGILGSATSAAASAAAAATSASNAATSASNASTSASNAATSASSASTSATNAAASYDAFDDRYLGSKSSAPTLDNDGNALLTGALYWNSTSSELYLWTGSAWTRSALSGTDYVAKSGDTMTGALTTTALTLSGGTANGVAYLNGSKVLTSGSALTFDGQYLGIGTGASSPNGIKFFANGGGLAANLTVNHSSGEIQNFATTNYFQTWYANNSEQMRLTSTGLGIGTSSPTGYLANKLVIATGTDSNNGITIASASNRNGSIWFADGTTGNQSYRGGIDYQHTTDTLYLYSGAQGNFILDSAGNLGLGVTPSAWASTYKAFQMGGGSLISYTGNDRILLGMNTYLDSGGNYTYVGSTYASGYNQVQGQHHWYTAPSGTANTAISFTQAMTLDASGNLMVGTTSTSNIANKNIDVNGTGDAAFVVRVGGTSTSYLYSTAGTTILGTVSTIPLVFNTNNTERARIDSSGNFGIGTSSPSGKLHVVGAQNAWSEVIAGNTTSGQSYGMRIQAGTTSADYTFLVRDASNTSEYFTVLGNGNIGIGTSSPGAKLDVSGANAGSVLQSRILNTSTSASSDAQNFIYVNGGTAGDPYTTWSVGGVTSWSAGIRNSDSDSWYLSPGSSLGTTPYVTVNTSGNVGIGTSSPSTKLDVNQAAVGSAALRIYGTSSPGLNIVETSGSVTTQLVNDAAGAYFGTTTAHPVILRTSGTERARFTSGGQFLVGNTAGASYKVIFENSGQPILALNSTDSLGGYTAFQRNGTAYGYIGSAGPVVTGGANTDIALRSENNLLFTSGGATERARITSAGGFSVGTTADPGAGAIYATGNITAYYSDARLKTVSGKIENALDKVAKLSGVYYTNNDTAKSFGYDSDEVQVGVLAQEVEAVMPEIVKAAPFDLDEEGNSKSGEHYKTVQYERLVPLLIEAINELRAEVKALKGV